jgi:hypothetical protein
MGVSVWRQEMILDLFNVLDSTCLSESAVSCLCIPRLPPCSVLSSEMSPNVTSRAWCVLTLLHVHTYTHVCMHVCMYVCIYVGCSWTWPTK